MFISSCYSGKIWILCFTVKDVHSEVRQSDGSVCHVFTCRICFAITRRFKQTKNILQDFVPLACNNRSNKLQFFFFMLFSLRGKQISLI